MSRGAIPSIPGEPKGRREAPVGPGMVVVPSWGRRIAGVEGLRGVAALSVMVAHVHVHMAPAMNLGRASQLVDLLAQGLTLFFALSGFLLYRPFAAALIAGRPLPSWRRFLSNRVLRIFPAYIVIFSMAAFVLGLAYTRSVSDTIGVGDAVNTVGRISNPWLIVTNLTLSQTLFPPTIKTGLGVSWTLTVELAFYLTLPMIAYLAYLAYRKRGSAITRGAIKARALAPAVVLIGCGLVGKTIVHRLLASSSGDADLFYRQWGANWTSVLARSLAVHADLFGLGMVAAVLVVIADLGQWDLGSIRRMRICALLTVPIALLIAKLTFLDDTMFGLISAVAIIVVVMPASKFRPSLGARVLEWLPIRYLGLISYSVYLWHVPVIWWVSLHGGVLSTAALWVRFAAVLSITVCLSSATYFLVERPALRLKKVMAS